MWFQDRTICFLYNKLITVHELAPVADEVHFTFIDLGEAYGNVPGYKLYQVLNESNISCKSIKTVEELYEEVTLKYDLLNI